MQKGEHLFAFLNDPICHQSPVTITIMMMMMMVVVSVMVAIIYDTSR